MSSYYTYSEFMNVKGEIPVVEFPDYRGDINKRIFQGSTTPLQEENVGNDSGGQE